MPRSPKLNADTAALRKLGHALAARASKGLHLADRDAMLQADAAGEMNYRLRQASVRVMRHIQRGNITEAAHAAGQMTMLARQIEIRLLTAVERRAGAAQVAEAVADVAPEPESPRLLVKREQQRARRARATE